MLSLTVAPMLGLTPEASLWLGIAEGLLESFVVTILFENYIIQRTPPAE